MTDAHTKFLLRCTVCDWNGPDGDLGGCPSCGGIITPAYPDAAIPVDPAQPGLWRYAAHLPLHDLTHAVTLGEGSTPLVPSARLGAELDLADLLFKLEGANPTGSYKDRIAAVGMSRLRELGKQAWAATSSGNAGASMAAYGVRAGVDGYLFTLEKASRAKIAQIMAYGPKVMAVERLGYDPEVETSTWANIRTVCNAKNWMMLVTAHAFSPHAMDGVKTLAYELCEQTRNDLPDVIYVPIGGGGLFAALWRGLVEWQAAGYVSRLPKLVAVQPCGCASVHQAFQRGDQTVGTIPDCTSTISGLQLTAPPDGDLVLQAVRASGGWTVAVPDADTYKAQADLAGREGLFVEPASAITLAGLRADRRNGRLEAGARVACILTGIGFKDGNALQRMVEHVPLNQITAGEILALAA